MKKVLDEGLKMEVFKTAPDFDKGIFDESLKSAQQPRAIRMIPDGLGASHGVFTEQY